jgi:N-methylhydantoinase B/oxoprolinase/acetone carboxylase alpha subunit
MASTTQDSPKRESDPIRAGLMWSKLRAIADEVAGTVVKTAVSTSVGVSEDFGCSVLDSRGRLMACGVPSVAQFSALLPRTMRMVLERFPIEEWDPGDVVISTDPWIGAGHAYDLILVTPAFSDTKLVAFVVSLAHTSDVGGILALSGAKDMFEEGLMLPLLKVYERGVLNEAVIEILRANIRLPDVMMGDFHALTAANQLGVRRLREMLEENDLEDYVALTDELEAYTERAARTAIAQLPDGVYRNHLDADGISFPVHLEVAITVDGDSLTVDYAGSDPQLPGQALNAVLNFTFSETVTAVQCVLTPTVSFNEGFLRAVTVLAPEGSVLNCQKPMPVKNRDKIVAHIETLIFGAFHELLPDAVLSASGTINVLICNGIDSRTGRYFNTYISEGAGTGAGAGYDGANALHFPWGSRNIPVELVETRAPVLVTKKEFRTDSGGPGEFRGGCGQVTALKPYYEQTSAIAIALYNDNTRFPAGGLHGGEAGVTTDLAVDGRRLEIDAVEMIESFLYLQPGEELVLRLAGGGGYGDPLSRDVEKVESDVQNGFVSEGAAAERYGVILGADGRTDAYATERTRHELRARKATQQAGEDR